MNLKSSKDLAEISSDNYTSSAVTQVQWTDFKLLWCCANILLEFNAAMPDITYYFKIWTVGKVTFAVSMHLSHIWLILWASQVIGYSPEMSQSTESQRQSHGSIQHRIDPLAHLICPGNQITSVLIAFYRIQSIVYRSLEILMIIQIFLVK